MRNIRITGISELEAKLKQNARLEDVKNIVKSNGSEMQGKTQRNAPVETGYLKRHIALDIEDSGMTARVHGGADYDPYQEYGTRYMSGTPHYKPAFNEQKTKFKSDLDRLTK